MPDYSLRFDYVFNIAILPYHYVEEYTFNNPLILSFESSIKNLFRTLADPSFIAATFRVVPASRGPRSYKLIGDIFTKKSNQIAVVLLYARTVHARSDLNLDRETMRTV